MGTCTRGMCIYIFRERKNDEQSIGAEYLTNVDSSSLSLFLPRFGDILYEDYDRRTRSIYD